MPKKTKKEKIIAEYRRKLGAIGETTPSPSSSHPPSPYAYEATISTPTHTAATWQPMDRAVRRDLVKTLILAAAAIAGEVVLSRILPS